MDKGGVEGGGVGEFVEGSEVGLEVGVEADLGDEGVVAKAAAKGLVAQGGVHTVY